ncbi:MAG: phosphopantetheine-binding protein, partial [Bacteroidota bacterium]
TRNGKVDKRSLPEVSLTDSQDYVGPSTAIEEELVGIWSEVLGIAAEELSVEANFFKLGGHSLMAIRVINRMEKHFSISLPMPSLFEYPNIERLASYVEIIQLRTEQRSAPYTSTIDLDTLLNS